MTYNVAEIAFYAAAAHLCDPRNNFLEEEVDNLARQNEMPEDTFDLITDFAEEIRDILLHNEDVSCITVLHDVLSLSDGDNKTRAHLIWRRDDLIGKARQWLLDIEAGPSMHESKDEAAETAAQIEITERILDDLSSRLAPSESDKLINIALEVDAIRKVETLNAYRTRQMKPSSAA